MKACPQCKGEGEIIYSNGYPHNLTTYFAVFCHGSCEGMFGTERFEKYEQAMDEWNKGNIRLHEPTTFGGGRWCGD